jgi:hypothetical protein
MQSTESFQTFPARSDGSESVEDPNERRKIQNRIAQKKHSVAFHLSHMNVD